LTCPLGTAGITGAQADAAIDTQLIHWRLQRARGVGGQGPHGRNPEHRQRGRLVVTGAVAGEALHGAEPDRVCLARASSGMQQPGFALAYRLPDFLLEGKGLPAAASEPVLRQRGVVRWSLVHGAFRQMDEGLPVSHESIGADFRQALSVLTAVRWTRSAKGAQMATSPRTPSASMLRPRPCWITSPRLITRYWSASSAAKS